MDEAADRDAPRRAASPAPPAVTVSPPTASPPLFWARADPAGPAAGPRTLRIRLADADGGPDVEHEYRLTGDGHADYLDLHERIARDFGTRMPLARERTELTDAPVADRAGDSDAGWQPLLTASLDPRILYGYGDPAVIRVAAGDAGTAPAGGSGVQAARWYLFATSNDAPDSFPIVRSADLRRWEPAGFVFPSGAKPVWAADGEGLGDWWAPELHRVGGAWRLYFVAREAAPPHDLAIGVATAASPEGPFGATEAPLLRGGAIDPHVVIDARDGSAWLLWKEDANDRWPSLLARLLDEKPALIPALFAAERDRRTAALARALWPFARGLGPMERFFVLQPLIEAVTSDFVALRERLGWLRDREAASARGTGSAADAILCAIRTPILARRLSDDGLSLAGASVTVLENDLDWEAHLVEGAWVHPHAGRYYLFYAGNDFSTPHYGIGVAVADTPLGPYRKAAEPLLRSTRRWVAPGHPSVAEGPDGVPRLFFHAFFPGQAGYKAFRALLAVPLAFEGERVRLLTEPVAKRRRRAERPGGTPQ